MRKLSLVAVLALASACVPTTDAQVTKARAPDPAGTETAAPALAFAANPAFVMAPAAVTRSNATVVRDFMELGFAMESGRVLPVFSRFEGTVTIAMTGDIPASAPADLARLIQRLRA